MSRRPKWSEEQLDYIFEKRRGKCSLCHEPIVREEYAVADADADGTLTTRGRSRPMATERT